MMVYYIICLTILIFIFISHSDTNFPLSLTQLHLYWDFHYVDLCCLINRHICHFLMLFLLCILFLDYHPSPWMGGSDRLPFSVLSDSFSNLFFIYSSHLLSGLCIFLYANLNSGQFFTQCARPEPELWVVFVRTMCWTKCARLVPYNW